MRAYEVCISTKVPKESWNAPLTTEDDVIGTIVEANSAKEAIRKFYNSQDCQKFIERFPCNTTYWFYFQHSSGIKLPFYGWIEL